MPIIRRAKITDKEQIIALAKKLLQYDYPHDNSIDRNWLDTKNGLDFITQRLRSKDSVVLIAECEEDQQKLMAGYLIGSIAKADDYRVIKILAELEEIFVLEKFRNKNVGSKLMEEFIAWCKKRRAKKISVTVSAANIRALKFYKRSKFQDYDLILERDL